MTRTIPSYLRLHNASATDLARTFELSIDPVSQFWQAYTDATGWRLDRCHNALAGNENTTAANSNRKNIPLPQLIPALDASIAGDASTHNDSPSVNRALAEQLAAAANELATKLQKTQDAYRAQEAELAVTATPTGTPDQSSRLASRLERLLAKAAAATGCSAAGLYMIDNDTTTLKLRASHGLPSDRIAVPPRSLRGSRGDLESLVRDVVMIDDLCGTLSTTWNSPESFAAAIVVRIEEDDLPIGTLWLWSQQAAQFSEHDGAAAQLAALSIASELSRASLFRERAKWNLTTTSIKSATAWQMRQLPPAMELAPGIIVDGWTESPRPWARSWQAWDVLPDGSIALAFAEAASREMDGAMIAATARAAFAAHSNYRHSATEMMRRISDSLWQTNTGDQLVSMMYLKLDCESGEGEIASAGSIQAIIAGQRGYRPLGAGREAEPLASQIDCRPFHTLFQLHRGEAIIGVNAAVLDDITGMRQSDLAAVAREAMSQPNMSILAAIRRSLAMKPLAEERAGILLMRK